MKLGIVFPTGSTGLFAYFFNGSCPIDLWKNDEQDQLIINGKYFADA